MVGYMASMQSRKKHKKPNRYRKIETPSNFNAKLFVALGLLLVVLLMKKYDLSIGDFNVDSLYHVVYYNEDLSALKEKIFFFNEKTDETEDVLGNIPSEEVINTLTPNDTSVQNDPETTVDEQKLPITNDSNTNGSDGTDSSDIPIDNNSEASTPQE